MRSAVSAARRAATAAAAASTISTGGGQAAALSKGELEFISKSILYYIREELSKLLCSLNDECRRQ